MRNWTVRARIIAAFATIIAIVAALGAVSLVQLGDVRTQATLLQTDVLPGLLLSSQASAQATTLLPAVLTLATGTDEQETTRAHGGTITVSSTGVPGEGTSFVVEIPLTAPDPATK